MSIPMEMRFHKVSNSQEKYLIRSAFSHEEVLNLEGNPLLPMDVLWRKKEAFSDGVSKRSRSLYEIIQEHAEAIFYENDIHGFEYARNYGDIYQHIAQQKFQTDHLLPTTAEQFYYRKIFEEHYSGNGDIIPYFWMPKYVDAKDASARTLEIYNE
jgi:asparagine synthase (glutamine-hydrolysing)